MPWFKVDDGFHVHAKAVQAGTAALGLWVRCGSWAAQQLTDGYVPVHIALFYGTKGCAKALVESGLWEQVEGGYRFHDWDDMNPTREQVLSDREQAKDRQRKAREAAKAKRDRGRGSREVTSSSQRDTPVTSPDVQSPRPEGSKEPFSPRDGNPPKLEIVNGQTAPSAGPVVAAYVDGHRTGGRGDPTSRLRARVGKDAARLLAEGVDPERLAAAAHKMGEGGWNDLDVQLSRMPAHLRRTGTHPWATR